MQPVLRPSPSVCLVVRGREGRGSRCFDSRREATLGTGLTVMVGRASRSVWRRDWSLTTSHRGLPGLCCLLPRVNIY